MDLVRSIAHDILLIGGALCIVAVFLGLIVWIIISCKLVKVANKVARTVDDIKEKIEQILSPIKMLPKLLHLVQRGKNLQAKHSPKPVKRRQKKRATPAKKTTSK